MQDTMISVLPLVFFLVGVTSLPHYRNEYRHPLFVPMVQYSSPQAPQAPVLTRTVNYMKLPDIPRAPGYQQVFIPRNPNYQHVIAISRAPENNLSPVVPRVQQMSQASGDYQYNVDEVAALKRAYQAAFAAMASKMATQTGIHWQQTVSPVLSQQNHLAYQPTQNLYHRNPALQVHPRPVILRPADLTKPLPIRPPYIPQQPSVDQEQKLYDRNVASQSAGQSGQEQILVLLPNGFLADTQEVQAAKEAHLAEVAKAIDVASRADAREAQQKATHGPGAEQRRVAVNYSPEEIEESYNRVNQPVHQYVQVYRNA